MTRDEIINMARESGLVNASYVYDGTDEADWKDIERFAALVAAAEREVCAKVCDVKAMHCEMKAQEALEAGEHDEVIAIRSTAWQISVCAADIRARGEA